MSNDNNELVQTVTGPVQLDSLGITLTHEHLSCIFKQRREEKIWWLYDDMYPEDEDEDDRTLKLQDITINKRYPYSNCKNLSFNETEMTKIIPYELSLFKSAGGKTIVENSSNGLQREINKLKSYSLESEINIIIGTGYFIAHVQDDFLRITHEEMYNKLLNDLTVGIKTESNNDDFKIKAGFIGEVGSVWPIHEFEKLSIRATGEVQAQLHCPVNLNPGIGEEQLREVIRLYQEAGGDSKKAAISNIDRTFWYEDKFMEFMDDTKHIYLQLDSFGIEHSFALLNDKYYKVLSDAQRIKRLAKVKEEGNLDRILISHDIHSKDRLITFGGHGYAHIMKNIVPHMSIRNFTVYDITTLTTENPKRWLSWNQ